MATLVLTDSQKCSLSIKPVDAKGKPAPVDGVPEWSSSDANVISVSPSADGLSAVIVAGDPGSAQVSVSADAELGSGVTTLTGALDVQVTGGQAVAMSISAGAPEEQ